MSNKKVRKVLITGATRGLGRAMAEKFASCGHTVIGCGRSRKDITSLRQDLPAPHRFDVVDVSHDGRVAAWASEVLATVGAPDLLLNNAGIINKNAPLWEVPADQFSKVVDVNVKGVVNVLRHFVPAMIKAQAGVIVNFSSGWGRSTSPEVAPYCATKWAIEGLTLALAQELPKGLAAIPVNPGIIDTEMLRSCWGDSAHQYRDAREWSESAVPFLLGLDASDNGIQATIH